MPSKKNKMTIFIKDKDGKLQETTLADLIIQSLSQNDFKMDNGEFNDNSARWVGIVQENQKRSTQVIVNINFDTDYNNIIEVQVFENPIKRVIDYDSSIKIL